MSRTRTVAVGLVVTAAVLAVALGLWYLTWYLPLASRRGAQAPAPAPADCRLDPAPVPIPTDPNGEALDYLHTCGGRLFDSGGREVRITGLNWFGMETETLAPHGLWSRNWRTVLAQISNLGYNAIRLPLSNDALVPGRMPSGINYEINPDLQGLTSLELLDAIINEAGVRGLRVVLDRHRPNSAGQSDLWYTDQVSEDRWISDWVMLARRYAGNDTVIGVDLHNEPKGAATWGTDDPSTDWRMAAERAGNAILDANPYLLIIVEGIEQYDGDWYWWGGNLLAARDHPVRLKLPGRLVYSAHDYGPGVYRQSWFDAPDYPHNLPAVWDTHWGYLQTEGIAPVLLGEFGGRSVDSSDAEGVWQRTLLDYLQQHGASYFTWSLNPNSGDTGGLLEDDWLNEVSDKRKLYSSYLAPQLAAPRHLGATASRQKLMVLYRANTTAANTNSISFSLQVINLSDQPVDLARLELRYWFSHGSQPTQPVAEVDYAAVGKEAVKAEIVKAQQGNQDHYLRITFSGQDTALLAYRTTGDIILRLHASNWAEYDQSNDYSFLPTATSYLPTDKVTAYLDGRLVSGREP